MNKFQIIIPCYNYQEYLNKCLESIENQEYSKDLIFVNIIDDNSEIPLKSEKFNFNINLIKNTKRQFAAYNRYKIYSKTNDNDIIIFLDGDDWLVDSKVLKIINNVFINNKISWAVSNHRTFKNGKNCVLPTFVNLPLELEKPKICHLRCGYGYVWNKMDIEWLKMDNEYIKWMTDWNENLYALKNFGQPYKIESSLSVYNLDTSKTRNENNNFRSMIEWFKVKMK